MKTAIKTLALAGMMAASAWTVIAEAAAVEAAPANPDPWEPFNRKIYAFNDVLDRYFLKPVAKGYVTVTPQFLKDGFHHMSTNVGEIGNMINSLLQAKFKHTAASGGRLAVNSTVGLLGFFDVASKMGLQVHEEDFGQTLGYWGVYSGPFIVVPFLGPRTVRDGFGSIADGYTDPIPVAVDHVPTRNSMLAGRMIDMRAQLLQAEELISGDRYIFLRDAYLQRRQFLIDDGAVQDSFGGDDFMYNDAADDASGAAGDSKAGDNQAMPATPPPQPVQPESD